MNRSILIVICDFLLVSLLAFSTVDINKTTNEGVPRQVKVDHRDQSSESRQDLAAVMRLALEQEHKGREHAAGRAGPDARGGASRQQALLQRARASRLQTLPAGAATEESNRPRSLSSNRRISCSSLPPPRPISRP